MGGFLGATAGLGMMVLIGALFIAFLHQAGAVNREKIQRLIFAAGITLAMGMVYWLLGGLFYGVLFEPMASIAEINAIFRTKGLEKMYIALEETHFYGFLSGIFAWLGHGLGKILFEQYLFAGCVLAIFMTFISVYLLMSRLERIFGKQAAKNGIFLLFCFPGVLFFFLPGWVPLALLLTAILFYLAGRKIPSREWLLPDNVYSWLLGISGMLSAAVVFGAVRGIWS